MDEDILTTDINPDMFNGCDAGMDAFDLYVVAPARFVHSLEGECIPYSTYCDETSANDSARRYLRQNKRDMVRYKLVPIERFNVKKDN